MMVELRRDREEPARTDSTAELIKQLSAQTSTLVRQELELANAELVDKGKKAAIARD